MIDTITIAGNEYEVTGYAEDGLPIIKATATSVQDGVDKHGNPKISTIITVPVAPVSGTPGQNG